jgi:hypothetical protein
MRNHKNKLLVVIGCLTLVCMIAIGLAIRLYFEVNELRRVVEIERQPAEDEERKMDEVFREVSKLAEQHSKSVELILSPELEECERLSKEIRRLLQERDEAGNRRQ